MYTSYTHKHKCARFLDKPGLYKENFDERQHGLKRKSLIIQAGWSIVAKV